MLATLTDAPFDDPNWAFETKWDGCRLVAIASRFAHASAT
jgi:bifunctional non-homologous end joining protein LigD